MERRAPPLTFPISAIIPSLIAISARTRGALVPSTSVPFLITRSYAIGEVPPSREVKACLLVSSAAPCGQAAVRCAVPWVNGRDRDIRWSVAQARHKSALAEATMSTTFGAMMFPTDYAIQPIELARAVEERGLDSLYFPEHTHIPTSRRSPWPGGADLPQADWHTHDPFVALGAAAAATKRIKLGTGG